MPTQTLTARPIVHDAIPVGSDFVGGAEAMPVRAAEPGPVVPGSDFAGGALPMTAEVERGQPNEERAAWRNRDGRDGGRLTSWASDGRATPRPCAALCHFRAVVVDVAWRYDWASPGLQGLTGTRLGGGGMTQQYIAGELSVLLARLQAAATTQAAIRDVAQLRREAETGPVTTLPSLVVRALALTDRLCWDSLERGDPAAFTRQGAICAELRDFGVCARLLQER